jgi:hypothetical protein
VFSRDGIMVRVLLVFPVLMAQVAYGATLDDELRVDPTAPLDFVAAANSESEESGILGIDLFGVFTSYELSSILIRAEDRIAVINETRVRVGDTVGSAIVASIEPDHVTLNVDGEIETLELYGNSIKTLVHGDD